MYFAALQPEWRCVANSTVCNLNGTFTSENNFRCNIPRNDWEFTQPKGYSIVTEFDIYCDTDWINHMATSILFIGWAFGAMGIGWLSDNHGRKKALLVSMLGILITNTIAPFVGNVYVFLAIRFVTGFFIPGGGMLMFTMISEVVSGRYRPRASLIQWVAFTLSLCTLGVIAYFVQQWKMLFLVCTVPFYIFLPLFKFVPESVRWLRLKGRMQEAVEIFQRIADWNGTQLNPNATLSAVKNADNSANPLDLFKGKRMAVKIFLLSFGWMVNAMVYYGLSLAADDLGGSLYLNFVLVSLVELPASVFSIDFPTRFGRKKTTCGGILLAGLVTLSIAFIPKSSHIIRVVLGMLGKLFVTVSFGVITLWSVELYPTNIRQEAVGFLQIASRSGGAAAPWIAKAVKVIHPSLPFVIMGSLGLLAGIAGVFLPETKGKEIQEAADDVIDETFNLESVENYRKV